MVSEVNINEENKRIFFTRIQELTRIIDAEWMPLSEIQLNWKSKQTKWSILQCIEHLNLAFKGYILNIDYANAKGKAEQKKARNKMKFTWVGKIMIWAVNPQSNLYIPAPSNFKPKHTIYTKEVLVQFKNTLIHLSKQLEAASDLDWNENKISSPLANLLKLSLGDTFEMLTLHALRHFKQAKNIMAHPKFIQV